VAQTNDVEELINESFIKLFKIIHLFESRKSDNTVPLLKGWLKRIVINTCIDHIRKKHTVLLTQEIANENETIAANQESSLDKISYNEIIEAIRQLSTGYRTIFNLFVIEGLSHEEISKMLNITTGASKSSLSKAKHNLRQILNKQRNYITHV
jgi:RNA polymerase sigma-70 factor (ECF subfamily)